MSGAIARQGAHHGAQKSISTAFSDLRTSWSKFASVTWLTNSLAIGTLLLAATLHLKAKDAQPGSQGDCPTSWHSLRGLLVDTSRSRGIQSSHNKTLEADRPEYPDSNNPLYLQDDFPAPPGSRCDGHRSRGSWLFRWRRSDRASCDRTRRHAGARLQLRAMS